MENRFLAIAGNMGSGKTSLVEFLVQHYGFIPFVEPNISNPYLDDFYKNFSAYAFHSQIYFLAHKFRIHKELESQNLSVVQDRTIYEDAEIFARNLYESGYIVDRDFNTYMDLYSVMKQDLRPPDLLIYLKCPVSALKKRIRLRGRQNEQSVPDAYLKKLNKLYEKWISLYNLSPVIVWHTDKMDYLTDWVDQLELKKAISVYF